MDSSVTNYQTLPIDVVDFCRNWLGYEPYKYMHPFLRDEHHFIALLQARQTGKTFNGMAKLLYIALRYPGSTIIISAPKFDQIKRIAFKHLHDHLHRMKQGKPDLYGNLIDSKGLLRTVIRFRNGSKIMAESPVPETIRGHTAKAVYLMEMNFIRDDRDLYTAVLFTLNTTDGYLLVESTPWNTDSVFHDIFHKPTYKEFSKHTLVYSDALPPYGPLTPNIVEMIKKQLHGDPSRWRREMLCEWTEDNDKWLSMNLIKFCQNPTLSYWGAQTERQGRFYVGVDFGKKQDHSVVAVMEEKNHRYLLRHCHRFKLNTSYGTVIGYVKKLQDHWNKLLLINCDQTGVGEYIVEDMKQAGIWNVNGVVFTEGRKEEMATILKETMRQVRCGECGAESYVDTQDGEWRMRCPEDGHPMQPVFQLPYDQDLFIDLNTPIFTLGKTGKIQFSHHGGTHDDMFWAICLSLYHRKKGFTKPLAKN